MLVVKKNPMISSRPVARMMKMARLPPSASNSQHGIHYQKMKHKGKEKQCLKPTVGNGDCLWMRDQ
ncbi:uncharacterized protein Dvar_74070 [Desulfosarcina variabilis str. Montpellier]